MVRKGNSLNTMSGNNFWAKKPAKTKTSSDSSRNRQKPEDTIIYISIVSALIFTRRKWSQKDIELFKYPLQKNRLKTIQNYDTL